MEEVRSKEELISPASDISKSSFKENEKANATSAVLEQLRLFEERKSGDPKPSAEETMDAVMRMVEAIATVGSAAQREELLKQLAKASGMKASSLAKEMGCLFRAKAQKTYLDEIKEWWGGLGIGIPQGYGLTGDGVVKYGAKSDDQLTTDPLWVNSLVTNLTDKSEEVELAWKTCEGSHTMILPLTDVFQKNELLRIAGDNTIPIRPTLIGKLTDYIADSIKENRHHLSQTKKFLSRKPGWVRLPDNRFEFSVYSDSIIFKAESTMQSAEHHLKQKGDLAGWMKLRPYIEKSDMLAFFIGASLAAPILEHLGVSGFCVDQYGDSSTGKTTTGRICASMYGRPGGQTGDGLVAPWHATPTYIEEVLGFYSHMPVFCMDSQDLKEEAIERVAYMVANGTGKGRGARDGGVRNRNEWKSVLMSDGESSIYERLTKNGAKARVISIHGAGCAGLEAADIEAVNMAIRDNYGVVAPLFIKKVQDLVLELPGWYKNACTHYGAQATTQIEKRVSGYFAIITVAVGVLAQVSGFEWFSEVFLEAIQKAWKIATSEIEEELPAKVMLQKVADWVTSRRQNFLDDSASTAPAAAQCYGRIVHKKYVAFVKNELDRFLESCKVPSSKMLLRKWLNDGILEASNGNYWKQVRMQGEQKHMICIKWGFLFPEDVQGEAVSSEKVVSIHQARDLSKATGKVLQVQNVIRDGEQIPYAVIDGCGGFYVEPSAVEALSFAEYGKESKDTVTVHYRMDLLGKWIVQVDVHKEAANA